MMTKLKENEQNEFLPIPLFGRTSFTQWLNYGRGMDHLLRNQKV